jgi:hypothetical protein
MNKRSTFDPSRRNARWLPIETADLIPLCLAFSNGPLRIWPAMTVGLLFVATASCLAQQPKWEPLQASEESQSVVDAGILPLAQLTTNVALPEEHDQHGEQLPMPIDYASSYFAQPPTAPLARFSTSCWPDDLGYGPALNFAYRPLYFEQVKVERYGRSFGRLIQPCLSTVHFYASAALLPCKMIVRPPLRHVYHDHPCRPGGTTWD